MAPIETALIVARAENGVIGRDGQLPWRIAADLQHFKRLTVGKPVVMGRKTFDSIGRPLPRRTNIVVTRNSAWTADGVVIANDLPTALALAYEDAHRTGASEVMIIGGADIYRQCVGIARHVYLTEVHCAAAGETVFGLGPEWCEVAREDHAPETEGAPAFSFVTLERAVAPNNGA